jgi:hypothetical protein
VPPGLSINNNGALLENGYNGIVFVTDDLMRSKKIMLPSSEVIDIDTQVHQDMQVHAVEQAAAELEEQLAPTVSD